MKYLPILMSDPMVRAILEDRKRMTRRVVKPQPSEVGFSMDCEVAPYCTGTQWPLAYYARRGACWNSSQPLKCPYGQPGDRLWVRETWAPCIGGPCHPDNPTLYRATEPDADKLTWKPSIHMPRWASRLTLEVVAVRVERLQEISEEDAKAEGIAYSPGTYPAQRFWHHYGAGCNPGYLTPQESFRTLWESINGHGSWEQNPWVWVVEFKRIFP